MSEFELLLNIDNKEVLIEILNNSIDFLIGNQDEQQTMRLSHKYGFHNPDDFLLTTRSIAKLYRSLCFGELTGRKETGDMKSELSELSPELQKIIPTVLQSRRNVVLRYLIREQNSSEYPLMESFDWDTRLVLGDSSFAQNEKLLTTLTMRLGQYRGQKQHQSQLHMQMNRKNLDEVISTIEETLQNNCK